MDDTVFDVFEEKPYTFLTIKRGTIAGNVIESQTSATGVFKLRSGMNSSDGQETKSSNSTLHIHPEESFIRSICAYQDPRNLIGHGIRFEGRDYEIIGATRGDNFDDGSIEHYRVTLQAADFSDFEVSA